MPQSEDVDWSFPLAVRDVVMTGRYGHLGFTRRPRRADHAAVAVSPGNADGYDMAAQLLKQAGGADFVAGLDDCQLFQHGI